MVWGIVFRLCPARRILPETWQGSMGDWVMRSDSGRQFFPEEIEDSPRVSQLPGASSLSVPRKTVLGM